jgi:hypothetical protein
MDGRIEMENDGQLHKRERLIPAKIKKMIKGRKKFNNSIHLQFPILLLQVEDHLLILSILLLESQSLGRPFEFAHFHLIGR